MMIRWFLKLTGPALLAGFLMTGAGFSALAQGVQGGNSETDSPRPKQPDSPDPLPRLNSPLGPTPAGPTNVPPGTYSGGPSAEADSVQNRARPEFDPRGVDLDALLGSVGLLSEEAVDNRSSILGSFQIFPTLEFDTTWDSNVFRNNNPQSSVIYTVKPAVSIKSDWSSHSLEFFANSEIARHKSVASEDYEDIGVGTTGVLEIWDNAQISASASWQRGHSSRGEIDDPEDLDAANLFDQFRYNLGGRYELLPLTLTSNFETIIFDFKSDQRVDNEDRDRTIFNYNFRASLDIDDGTSVFVQPSFNLKNYRRKVDSGGLKQNNHGYKVETGLSWDASGVTFAEFGLGYLFQTFEENQFADISGISASARAIWNFTDLWTLSLNLDRSVEETADVEFSGVLVTAFGSQLDFEFMYSTIFTAKFDYSIEDYKGGSRTDNRYSFGFQARHLLNEYLWGEFVLEFDRLSSDEEGSGFRSTIGTFRIGAQI